MAIVPQKYDRKRTSFAEIKAPVTTFFLNVTSGSGSTASTTFVDYPGSIEKIVTKRETATSLFASGFIGGFVSGVGRIDVGLRMNGIDWLAGQLFFNTINEHGNIPFNLPFGYELLAGNYAIRLRWKTNGVTGVTNGDDRVQIRFEEGYWA